MRPNKGLQLQRDHFTSAELKQYLRTFRNSQETSDGGKSYRANRPERPKNWQQSPIQVKAAPSVGMVQSIQWDVNAAVSDTSALQGEQKGLASNQPCVVPKQSASRPTQQVWRWHLAMCLLYWSRLALFVGATLCCILECCCQ